MARAVIYARFSSSKQREASIEDQLRVCRAWCADNGYEVVAEYCDRAKSGRTDDRPQFQLMISNAGESDVVLVYAMDRFSRDRFDAPVYKKRLSDKGVKVVSATEAMPDGPEAMIIESLYEAMAAMESAHISQRARRGMEGNALKCHHNGVRLFGYDCMPDGSYAVNDGEAAVVREVFERRLSGEAPNSIARDLAERGVRTARGGRCTYSMVSQMLRNEKYMGTYSWGGVRVEGGMPPIVGRDTFMAAQRVVSRKVRAGETYGDFAFSGRGVCLGCGMNLVGTSGHGKSGKRYDYYRCSHKCGVAPIRADALEAVVASRLRELLSDRETAMGIADAVSGALADDAASRRLSAAQRALSEAKGGIANIMRAVEQGMEYSDVAERLAELKAQRDRAESDVRAWEGRTTVDPESFADFLQSGAALDDRHLLDAFVWQVRLGDDEIVAILNYDIGGEPASIEVGRGFADFESGGPDVKLCEHGVAVVGRRIAIVMPRAAA